MTVGRYVREVQPHQHRALIEWMKMESGAPEREESGPFEPLTKESMAKINLAISKHRVTQAAKGAAVGRRS